MRAKELEEVLGKLGAAEGNRSTKHAMLSGGNTEQERQHGEQGKKQ